MTEPLDNVGFVCKGCAPAPNPALARHLFKWYLGKYCKLGFPITKGPRAGNNEYMWVLVTGKTVENRKTMLVGVLNNDPVFVTDYKNGDGVAFGRDEICEIME